MGGEESVRKLKDDCPEQRMLMLGKVRNEIECGWGVSVPQIEWAEVDVFSKPRKKAGVRKR